VRPRSVSSNRKVSRCSTGTWISSANWLNWNKLHWNQTDEKVPRSETRMNARKWTMRPCDITRLNLRIFHNQLSSPVFYRQGCKVDNNKQEAVRLWLLPIDFQAPCQQQRQRWDDVKSMTLAMNLNDDGEKWYWYVEDDGNSKNRSASYLSQSTGPIDIVSVLLHMGRSVSYTQ
jgi:hypothetical protein